jgi:hypothetical protein
MRILARLSALLLVMALAACNTVPIMNVDKAAVSGASGKPLTDDQVKGAIIRAGSGLGWQMTETGPGNISGTLMLRTHTAVVSIPYSSSQYSIIYKSSTNLDEKDGNIHKNYNGWIQNLNKGINAQLAAY